MQRGEWPGTARKRLAMRREAECAAFGRAAGLVVTSCRFGAQSLAELERKRSMILRIVIGIVVGGGLGFGWYKLVGCSTGTCPLTSNPFISTLYGGVVGALVASSVH
jgi:hypothetical protein